MKACKHCGEEFEGRSNQVFCCIVCKWTYNKGVWRKRHPEKAREQSRRGHRAAAAKDPEYNKRKCQKWREANPEAKKRSERKWLENNREKVKANRQRRRKARTEAAQDVVEYQERMTLPGVGRRCFYCGKECGEDFHWDHHVPLNAGGKDEARNLVLSCPQCNLRKGPKRPQSVFCEEILR